MKRRTILKSSAIVLSLGTAVTVIPFAARSEEKVPDALSVEWQGQKPCEKLFEDAQILVARCTFPPGAMHLRHSHPGYSTYVLSGGKLQIEDEKGNRQVEVHTDSFINSPPIPWHEGTNVGDTTLRALLIERKYEPVPKAQQATGK